MEGTAWSTVHGVPRRVRVRYSGTASTPSALMGTLLTLAAVIFVLGWLAALTRSGSLASPGGVDPRWLAAALLPVLGLALLACLVLGVVALVDLVHRTDVTGRVIDRWVQERLSDRGSLRRRRY